MIYLFGSGLAFFLGTAGLWCSILLAATCRARWMNRLAAIIGIVSLLLVGLSAAPLPYWYYGIACSLTAIWLTFEQSLGVTFQTWRIPLRFATGLIWLAGAAWEMPYQFRPTLSGQNHPPLFIIADSVTAGVGEHEAVTWPVLLQHAQDIIVHDYSQMGAGVASGYSQAQRLPESSGIVLIEIGGNDLLGTTSLVDFERGLDRLLDCACKYNRTVILFELPLPPFCNEYGRIQRRSAARYRVPLVPKRYLTQVIARPGNTLDSIHLSAAGHHEFAELVWRLIRPAYQLPVDDYASPRH